MKIFLICILMLLNVYGENIGYPEWFLKNENTKSVSVCLKIENSISTARTIAITKAKAELQSMQEVQIESEVILEKTRSDKNYNSSYKETIRQNSQGLIGGYEILKSDLFIVDGIQNICILYGKKENLIGEKN